jgi:hypothetical protein
MLGTALEVSTLTIAPPMRFPHHLKTNTYVLLSVTFVKGKTKNKTILILKRFIVRKSVFVASPLST